MEPICSLSIQQNLESRDLSPIAKLPCDRGLTSLGRFPKHAKTTVNMTSKLLLLASRNLERKKGKKEKVGNSWLLAVQFSHVETRRQTELLRSQTSIDCLDVRAARPGTGQSDQAISGTAVESLAARCTERVRMAPLRRLARRAACNSDTRYIASIGTPTNDPEGLSDAIPLIPLSLPGLPARDGFRGTKRTSSGSPVAGSFPSCRPLHSATPQPSEAESPW